jgi:hypothetical protein
MEHGERKNKRERIIKKLRMSQIKFMDWTPLQNYFLDVEIQHW